ncbi:MAG: signal peptidase II [Oligoflexia bacterium]|nr:signal peptidase II [Oligoflexia bacterium]
MRKILCLFFLVVAIIVLDQFTKYVVAKYMFHGESIEVISGLFNFTFVKNTGVAFGMGATATPLYRMVMFIFVPILACIWLLFLIWNAKNKSIRLGLAYSMILAGAVGNLIDRISIGYVVDFFHFYFKNYHFAVFNVADSCITIAAGILIIDFIIEIRKNYSANRVASLSQNNENNENDKNKKRS